MCGASYEVNVMSVYLNDCVIMTWLVFLVCKIMTRVLECEYVACFIGIDVNNNNVLNV
jgi:hypothetical protein